MERDRARFRDIVRGHLRQDLRRYLSSSELLGRQGGDVVSIPIPQIELPRFRFGENRRGGVGQGAGDEGEPVEGSQGADGERGQVGADSAGEHALEVDVELDELARIMGEELELPNIQPRGNRQLSSEGGKYTGISRRGPRSLRHFRRTFRRALVRTIAQGDFDPENPRVLALPTDERFRARKPRPMPDSSAVIIHMMDVSGSMGREQKDIVRIKAFWIDTWLRSQYENLEVVYIVHDARAKVVDQDSFFRLRESGGTKISSAYELCAEVLAERYPADDWNVYPFHYSDGDNWSARDTQRCMEVLREQLLPRSNQFCYGQVKSAYGSGQFKKDLDQVLGEDERVITQGVAARHEIADAIKAFLGKGR